MGAGRRAPGLALLTWAVPGAAVAAVAAAAVVRPGSWPRAADLVLAAALLLAAAASELFPVRVGPNQKASIASVPLLLGGLLLGPLLAAGVAAFGILGGNALLRRRPATALFNSGNAVLSTLVVAGVAGGGSTVSLAGVVRMVAAGVLFWAVSVTLAAWAAALQRREPLLGRLPAAAAATWAQGLAFAAIAVSIATLGRLAPAAAVLPLLFLPILYRMNVVIESELESNERLQKVLAGQRRFLTDVSHNVGNPLATIRTDLSLLRKAHLNHQQVQALEDAAAEGRRLSELFKRLRLLAETDEGLPLRKQRVDLGHVAADLVRAYTAEAQRRGVTLVAEDAGHSDVDADEELLRQAAANLLENALRLTPAGRAVRLRVGRSARKVSLDVIDEGPGIEPDLLPSIFERFKKGPGGGSGLGLAIARNVVERHGGAISVDSSIGRGARFTITLPAAG